MVQNKCDFINKMLFNPDQPVVALPSFSNSRFAFSVHSSIKEKWDGMLHKLPINWKFPRDSFEYTLQIGEKCFDMRIINIELGNDLNRKFLQILIKNSQVSFPWEANPTLFINREAFYILQQFIVINKLQLYVSKIEVKSGITTNEITIKVVTFYRSVNDLDIIAKYKNHLKSFETYRPPQYYFVTHAFEWQQPRMLQHLQYPIVDKCYSIITIMLRHLGQLIYANGLNMFDLLMLRFALCDYLNPSTFIQYEIDFMIKRELFKSIINNHLDLEQYMIVNNCTQREVLFGYLIYEFQNYFETIAITQLGSLNGKEKLLKCRKVKFIVDLKDEVNVVNKLRQKSNVEFNINGVGYDQMSLSLFLDLVECHNVRRIYLDTNYRWIKNEYKLNRTMSKNYYFIYLLGRNTYNFVEDFVSSLKINPIWKKFLLTIYCTLNDYRIFDYLKIRTLTFAQIHITTLMLAGVQKCKLKSKIKFLECTFENTRHSWALLNSSKKLTYVEILEDQGTWQSLFEFISNELVTLSLNEFHFNDNKRIIIKSGDKPIHLNDNFFTLDDVNQKLEIRIKNNNQLIDLYDLKFSLQLNDKFDFDFYQ